MRIKKWLLENNMARLEGSETKNQNGRIEHSKVLSLSLQVDGTMVEKEEFSSTCFLFKRWGLRDSLSHVSDEMQYFWSQRSYLSFGDDNRIYLSLICVVCDSIN